ncbi:hypothetical protein HIM_03649 [Hirsutella minnesotensis 3608]|uniref:MYND-type domain-containing protein n=1 Tax=Hirsutella minnesotensis 3608 TaxID=1043627 RepID=A0A0F8A266_9HYPO|nr:hypothetical protein HIM_03649 [Hirsutella minnesotensis 3608]
MLTPTIASRFSFFYAVGNTPATNLARSIPHGQDAEILALGCGDLRNILFTAYVDTGLASRKLDFTCCDYDERVIGRNLILLTLIIDGQETASEDCLWTIYYHLYIDEKAASIVLDQTNRILPLLESIETWSKGSYGAALKFCDGDTLRDARRICRRILDGAKDCRKPDFRKTFEQRRKSAAEFRVLQLGKGGQNFSGMRSAAPLSLQSVNEIPKANEHYWSQGTVTPRKETESLPNPMFASLVSEDGNLHYGTDPVLGFHLAAAFAPLSPKSPMKPRDPVPGFNTAAAAMTQFREWVAAFRLVVKRGLVVRFVVAEALAFCHTLQHAAASGDNSANWYRRLWEMKPLNLDDGVYGRGRHGPVAFDMIDTSNLSDHMGALNVIIATGPLLKQKPWSTLYTELLIKRGESQQRVFDTLLCGHAPTLSLLLGISPVHYWTNAKSESHVDELFLGYMSKSDSLRGKETQLHSRLAWKRDDQLSGQYVGRGRLHIDEQALCRLLFHVYLEMFRWEGKDSIVMAATSFVRGAAYSQFHRGSFAALLKLIKGRVRTDWPGFCSRLLDSIAQDRILDLNSNFLQDLCVQMHLQGVSTETWLLNEVKLRPDSGPLKGWQNIPPTVAVTIVVPREAIDRLYSQSLQHKVASPTIVVSIRASEGAQNQWHNMYSDVQITFGKAKPRSAIENEAVVVEEDERGWEGRSPLIASFMASTAALQIEPTTALIGLSIPPSVQGTKMYYPILGPSMSVFETRLDDRDKVLVSKLMPGQTAHRIVSAGTGSLEDAIGLESKDRKVKILTELPASESRITTMTGHVDIISEKGRRLLRDKVPIEIRQKDPFVIEVVFGEDRLVCPLKFPVPVTTLGSKSRVARTSGYVEVVAPLADPVTSEILADFVYPTNLSPANLPVAQNMAHVGIGSMPILNLADKAAMKWLTTHTSLQFSSREKRLRDKSDESGISENPRVNFKESLFSMFMLVSGLQGGQTGLFAINHPQRGGIHMLILVSSMRLDGDAASVLLDAAVIPFTMEIITSGCMESFLLLIRTLQCCTLNVNDAELILWKKVLPSFVERCRTWPHLPSCEYKRKGAKVPLSIEPSQQVLCSCGNGKLPKDFVSLPEWDVAAPNAVRIAISPTFAVPFVEDVVDPNFVDQVAAPQGGAERCHGCHKAENKPQGVTLKKCMRCLQAKYCSADCQKKDWKKHRMECKEVG